MLIRLRQWMGLGPSEARVREIVREELDARNRRTAQALREQSAARRADLARPLPRRSYSTGGAR